jgi:2'-5' RNA ligase
MRLFIAINFDNAVKNALSETIADLRGAARRGRYTPWDNLHLTLAFIGESERIEAITGVMGDVARDSLIEPLRITLSGAGVFGGKGGDLHWVGIEGAPELSGLAEGLANGLRQVGLDIDCRRFVPHVTIGRGVIVDGEAIVRVHPASMLADHISLMRSERINGRQAYSEVARVYSALNGFWATGREA